MGALRLFAYSKPIKITIFALHLQRIKHGPPLQNETGNNYLLIYQTKNMKKSILFITSFFLCVFCLKSNAQPSRPEVTWENMEGVTVPIPPQVHPRLYVRSADLPDLKKRMEHPHVKEVLATLNKLGKDRTPEEEAKVKDRGFRYYFEMRGVTSRVQVQALDYLVYGDKKQARSAITAMLDTLQNVNYGQKAICRVPAV